MNCVVIPAYRAAATILPVIAAIGPEIDMIVVVDDGCPEGTALFVASRCSDPRVVRLMHDANQGVGGAFLTGMRYAIERGADIIVKIDADGQMDPSQVPALIHPIVSGQADYVKGDRFFFLTNAASMPRPACSAISSLSFMAKLSSGYWTVMDPTNGFFAIHARVAELLDEERIAKRFFFETDLLFHLGLIRAKVVEFPMRASYGDEVSNLRISHQLAPFLGGHIRNTLRRILYRYFFREFSLASIQLVAGTALFGFGLVFGLYHWWAAPHGSAGADRHHHDRGADVPDRLPAAAVVSQLRHQFEPARTAAPVPATTSASDGRGRRARQDKRAGGRRSVQAGTTAGLRPI